MNPAEVFNSRSGRFRVLDSKVNGLPSSAVRLRHAVKEWGLDNTDDQEDLDSLRLAHFQLDHNCYYTVYTRHIMVEEYKWLQATL
jgi:hypothetical protein